MMRKRTLTKVEVEVQRRRDATDMPLDVFEGVSLPFPMHPSRQSKTKKKTKDRRARTRVAVDEARVVGSALRVVEEPLGVGGPILQSHVRPRTVLHRHDAEAAPSI